MPRNETKYGASVENLPADALGCHLRKGQSLTHELNNALAAISGYADLMLIKLPQDTAVYGYAEQIKQAVAKCASVARQLSDFANDHPIAGGSPSGSARQGQMQKRQERAAG